MTLSEAKHRFYILAENISGDIILIARPEYHHIVDVIRCKEGDSISLFDGKGNEFEGNIVSIDRNNKEVKVKINKVYKDKSSGRSLILVQSLVKGEKMDFIVQKATEIGVTHILPVKTKYSVVKLDSRKENLKIKKWRRIIQEASKQCGRTRLPVLDRIWGLDESLSFLDWVDTKIICTIGDKGINLKDTSNKKTKSIAVAIGPEGGFASAEVELAESYGWVPVRVGDIKMRSETAAIVMLGILCYEYDYFLS